MASERAIKRAANIGHIDPLTGTKHIVSESVAEALDAERIAGMEEAAKIVLGEPTAEPAVKAIRAAIEAEKKGAGL